MVCLYNHFSGLRIGNGLSDVTAGDTLLQALDGLFAIGKCLDLHIRDILAFAAVYLTHDQILGYVYQTTGKVTGVCGTQRGISSGHSVRMVELAKQLVAHVMAEVTPHHFSLDETAVLKHGTLAKMNPPLRTLEDKQEILRGLKEGVIDIIATDHAPHSAEEKAKPLTEAPSGIIGLETALALGVTNLVREDVLTMPQLMEKMSLNPAILYHLEGNKGHLSTGADADLVLFDPNEKWTVKEFKSKATNSPFIGEELYGKVKYTICGGKIAYVAIPLRNN